MPTLTLTLPKPHAAQRQMIAEAKRWNVASCGRRIGKTTLGQNRCVGPLLEGKPVGWFSPTYKMLSDVWRDMVETLQPVTKRTNASERQIELITGGILDMWSLDNPDVARGRKYARVVIDEAAMIPQLQNAWQMVIRPTLTDYAGDGWFLSTPKGMNFFRQCYDWGQDPEHSEWKSWKLPTSSNPYIAPAEIEAARLELPERVFQQEYLADFLEDAGGVFRGVQAASTASPTEPVAAGDYVMGVDWGQQEDFTVLSIVDRTNRKQVALDRFNQIDWSIQRGRLRAMADKWGVSVIIAEHNSIGGPNIEALQNEGLPVIAFQTTASSKPPLIESLALAFERSELAILNNPVQVSELQAYERTVSRMTGRSSYSAPAGYHDDTVMALALAWHGVAGNTGSLFL
jgi:hypothetical protein